MKTIIAFDPGAKRMGWAILQKEVNGPPIYIESGIVTYERNDLETYQNYRLRLMGFWAVAMHNFIKAFDGKCAEIVSEIVPVQGFNQASQSILAMTAITAAQTIALAEGFSCFQIGATTVKTQIGGDRKATKRAVRNGVITLLPELAPKKQKEWKTVFDESDAIAIGLTHLGCSNKQL